MQSQATRESFWTFKLKPARTCEVLNHFLPGGFFFREAKSRHLLFYFVLFAVKWQKVDLGKHLCGFINITLRKIILRIFMTCNFVKMYFASLQELYKIGWAMVHFYFLHRNMYCAYLLSLVTDSNLPTTTPKRSKFNPPKP